MIDLFLRQDEKSIKAMLKTTVNINQIQSKQQQQQQKKKKKKKNNT